LSKGGISSAYERKTSEDFENIDSISTLIGIDIESKAKEIVAVKSPDGHSRRQIAKPINPNPFSIIPQFDRPQDIAAKGVTTRAKNSSLSRENSFVESKVPKISPVKAPLLETPIQRPIPQINGGLKSRNNSPFPILPLA
jgi:hypothetical protein